MQHHSCIDGLRLFLMGGGLHPPHPFTHLVIKQTLLPDASSFKSRASEGGGVLCVSFHPFGSLLLQHRVSLQREAALHLVRHHLGDGQGGRGGRRGGVPHVEHAARHVPDPAVEHKVVHQVPGSVQSLSSNS